MLFEVILCVLMVLITSAILFKSKDLTYSTFVLSLIFTIDIMI